MSVQEWEGWSWEGERAGSCMLVGRSLGRDTTAGAGSRRLMFDLEPRVFPLVIFILCTWQWAAGDLLCGQRGGGQGVQLGLLWASKGCRHSLGVRAGEGKGKGLARSRAAPLLLSHRPGPALGPSRPQVSLSEGMAHMREGPAHAGCKGRPREPSGSPQL